MNKFKNFIIIIFLLCNLCSCSYEGNDLNMKLSSENKTLIELSTKAYEDDEITSIMSFTGSIQELNKIYPIECIRKIPVGYRVSYCGISNFISILFDNSGNKLIGNIYKISNSKSYFNNLIIGNSIEEVKRIDPNGNYVFLYTGRNDIPKQSVHYTSDGYLLTISYDENNLISNIESEYI